MTDINTNFAPGMIVATAGVEALMKESDAFHGFVAHSLLRHLNGDWGDLCEEDTNANDEALESGARLLSNYPYEYDGQHMRIWIITEAQDDQGARSATTVLFPEEY